MQVEDKNFSPETAVGESRGRPSAEVMARAAHCLAAWQNYSYFDRAQVVRAVAARMRGIRDQLANNRTHDIGALRAEAQADVDLAADSLEQCAMLAIHELKPKAIQHAPYHVLKPIPLGVILRIDRDPMSYTDLARFVGPNLMAGNAVLVMSGLRMLHAPRAFSALFDQLGGSKGLCSAMSYDLDLALHLMDDARLRGIEVMRRTGQVSAVVEHARRLHKHVVQDVSRNHVVLVLDDMPLADVLDNVLLRGPRTSRLTSVSARRVIVVGHERARELTERLRARLAPLAAGDPSDPSTSLAPMPSQRAIDIFLHQMQLSRIGGARLALGGAQMLLAGTLRPTDNPDRPDHQ